MASDEKERLTSGCRNAPAGNRRGNVFCRRLEVVISHQPNAFFVLLVTNRSSTTTERRGQSLLFHVRVTQGAVPLFRKRSETL